MATASIATANEPGSAAETEGQPSDMLARIDKEVRAFVTERPVLALLGAITAGYLIGRVLRRRG